MPSAGAAVLKKDKSMNDPIERQSAYVSIRRDNCGSKRRKLNSSYEKPFSTAGAPFHASSDSTSSSGEESDLAPGVAYEASRQHSVQQRQRELLQQTTAEPDDVEAWLSLIGHQEELVRSSDMEKAALSASQRRTSIELRLSLYEEALSKVGVPEARQRLLQGFLRDGSKIWDTQQQRVEWERLLTGDASYELRVLHINFLVSNPSVFSYDKCLQTLEDYLSIYLSRSPSVDRDMKAIYWLLRATFFMQQAGYTERAVAIWQAVLEYNFFGPEASSSSDRIASFENFWDSEIPRLGEPGASGWMLSAPSILRDSVDAPIDSQAVRANKPSYATASMTWALAEGKAERTSAAKTTDDVEDPYSIIMFPDIRQWLFKTVSSETTICLLDAFLCFCSFPQTRHEHEWALDGFLLQTNKFRPPSGELDVVSLFAPLHSPIAAFTSSERNGRSSLVLNVVRRIALAWQKCAVIAVYALAAELAVSPQGARKLAKKLVQNDPEDLQLYSAYAICESRLGNTAAADKIWAMTSDLKGVAAASPRDRLAIMHTWIWETISSGEHTKATSLLVSLAHPVDNPSPTQKGHSQENPTDSLQLSEDYVRGQLSQAYSQSLWDMLIVCADLLAYLRYTKQQRDIQEALAAYDHVLSMSDLSLDSTTPAPGPKRRAIERIHIHRAHLIYIHTSTPKLLFQPREIIKVLSTSTHLFPSNSAVRQLYQTISQKHGSIDRLRELAISSCRNAAPTDTTTSTAHPLALLQNITNELSRPSSLGGTSHAVRAAFKRAKDPESPLHSSPAVQLAHLRWEVDLLRSLIGLNNSSAENEGTAMQLNGAMREAGGTNKGASKEQGRARKRQRQRVMQAYREAVAACPWVKAVYLAIFDTAIDADGEEMEEEWTQAYESMLARGLRVRVECRS